MAIDPRINPLVSPLAETLFPEIYREQGPLLVAFMRAYMEWAETDGATYHSRRLLDYGDVDLTPDDLLPHLRAKYLDGVPLTSSADVRMLIKHALDVFRSRGSPRGLDLFFRLAYGQGADVYYPATDLLRPSTGRWTLPRFLEVYAPLGISGYVGREIRGRSSGAEAFVERAFRKIVRGKVVDALALSATEGHFTTGEVIDLASGSSLLSTVVGSLTSLTITDGASWFVVGDEVRIDGGSGVGARALVSSVSDATGFVDFSLEDGGYGYTVNAACLISNAVLILSNTTVDAANHTNSYFTFLETLAQPMINVGYSAATATPSRGDAITLRNGANAAVATGVALSVAPSNSTAGYLLLSVYTGNAATANTLANTYVATVSSQSNSTVTGRVISEGDPVTLTLSSKTMNFSVGETVTQATPTARGVVERAAGLSLTVFSRVGQFTSSAVVTGSSSGAMATTLSVEANVAVDSVSGTLAADSLAMTRGLSSNTSSVGVSAVSSGTGAAYGVASIADTETLSLVQDFLNPYTGVVLNAATYGLTGMPTANLATFLHDALTFANVTIGRIAVIHTVAPGSLYNASPACRPYEPRVWCYQKQGWRLPLEGATAPFTAGEIVTQPATGARGYVLDSNSSVVTLRRASLLAEMVPTSNSTTVLTGSSSGATANAVAVWLDPADRPLDVGAAYDGADAAVDADSHAESGVAATLTLEESGFGYVDGDVVSFIAPTGLTGSALARLGEEGVGPGYYSTTASASSANKHLWDGRYWQEMSYEIQTGVSPSAYDDAVERFQHVTGTARFDRFKWSSTGSVSPAAAPAVVSQS